jgi:hypothetical protein
MLNSLSQSKFLGVPKNPKISKSNNNINNLYVYSSRSGAYATEQRRQNVRTMNASKPPICPKCHKPMRLALVKGIRGRRFRCIDCEGEDPFNSPDISRLLEGMRPPE